MFQHSFRVLILLVISSIELQAQRSPNPGMQFKTGTVEIHCVDGDLKPLGLYNFYRVFYNFGAQRGARVDIRKGNSAEWKDEYFVDEGHSINIPFKITGMVYMANGKVTKLHIVRIEDKNKVFFLHSKPVETKNAQSAPAGGNSATCGWCKGKGKSISYEATITRSGRELSRRNVEMKPCSNCNGSGRIKITRKKEPEETALESRLESRLRALKKLYEKKLITKEQFEKKQKEVLSTL